jgi:hypothetical protein
MEQRRKKLVPILPYCPMPDFSQAHHHMVILEQPPQHPMRAGDVFSADMSDGFGFAYVAGASHGQQFNASDPQPGPGLPVPPKPPPPRIRQGSAMRNFLPPEVCTTIANSLTFPEFICDAAWLYLTCDVAPYVLARGFVYLHSSSFKLMHVFRRHG